jgi:lysophospholipase L1-like esterase
MIVSRLYLLGALVGGATFSGTAFSQQTHSQVVCGSKIMLRSGQSLAFLGASISEFGWNSPTGYIKLAIDNLTANGVNIVPMPVGVSGNNSRDMLARLERDVISKKPNWVAIDAGGNDVWHGPPEGVDFAEYMRNMTSIVERCQAAGIRVIIQTCTPIGEELDNATNQKLHYYNTFLRFLAEKKGCVLADLNADSVRLLKAKTETGNYLTTDGVHMNDRGNRLMAIGLLKALGSTDDQISKTIPVAEFK